MMLATLGFIPSHRSADHKTPRSSPLLITKLPKNVAGDNVKFRPPPTRVSAPPAAPAIYPFPIRSRVLSFVKMKNFNASSAIVAAFLLTALSLQAKEEKRISPHETVSAAFGEAQVKITYGRPYTKDPKSGAQRKIWGGLVPFGQVWRMGADEATVLTTNHELMLGDKKIPAGSYSLFLQPQEDGPAQLIVNKQTGQWGTKHDAGQDIAKIDLKKDSLAPSADQFTIVLEQKSPGGVLHLQWENTEYTAPVTVK